MPDSRTIFDYIKAAREAQEGDPTHLDAFRYKELPPKAATARKPRPTQPTQAGLEL